MCIRDSFSPVAWRLWRRSMGINRFTSPTMLPTRPLFRRSRVWLPQTGNYKVISMRLVWWGKVLGDRVISFYCRSRVVAGGATAVLAPGRPIGSRLCVCDERREEGKWEQVRETVVTVLQSILYFPTLWSVQSWKLSRMVRLIQCVVILSVCVLYTSGRHLKLQLSKCNTVWPFFFVYRIYLDFHRVCYICW